MSEITEPQSSPEDFNTTTANIIYILFLVNIIVPFTALVGVIMAYVNKSDSPVFMQSHYQFQIRTFWIGVLYGFIGALLTAIFIGWLVLLFTLIWWIVRCVKGMQQLGKQAPMPNPTSWMFG
jgi:uncharacterized membrane protein